MLTTVRETPVVRHPNASEVPHTMPGFNLAAALLLGITLCVRATIAIPGWFYADDLATLGRVHRTSFLDTVAYGEGGHVAFIGNAIGWVIWRLLGFDWFSHVAWMLLGFSIVALLLLWLLVRLYGKRIGVLVCWMSALLASAMAPSLMWLSQSSVIWGMLLPSLVVAHAYVSYTTRSQVRWLLIMAATLVSGVFISERTALLAPELLLLLTVALWRRPGLPAFRILPPVCATLAVLIPYLAYYYRSATETRSAPLGIPVDAALRLAGRGFLHVWMPTMAGGPWFLDTGQVLPRAVLDNPLWPVALLLAALVLVLGSLLAGLRGALAGAIVILFGLLDVLAVVWARAGSLGEYAVAEWRYYSHTAIPMSVALAIMFIPWHAANPTSRSAPRSILQATLVGLSIAWGFGALHTAFSMAPQWASNPARAFLGATLEDLRQTTRPRLVDRQLPSDVIPPLLTTATRASWVLAGALPRPAWDTASTDLMVIDDSGHLAPVEVTGGVHGLTGPEEECGWRIRQRPVRVPLEDELFEWNWVLEIGYLSSGWMSVPINVNGRAHEVPIATGVGQTQLPFAGSVESVTIGPVPLGASLCVDRLHVGEATAAGTQQS